VRRRRICKYAGPSFHSPKVCFRLNADPLRSWRQQRVIRRSSRGGKKSVGGARRRCLSWAVAILLLPPIANGGQRRDDTQHHGEVAAKVPAAGVCLAAARVVAGFGGRPSRNSFSVFGHLGGRGSRLQASWPRVERPGTPSRMRIAWGGRPRLCQTAAFFDAGAPLQVCGSDQAALSCGGRVSPGRFVRQLQPRHPTPFFARRMMRCTFHERKGDGRAHSIPWVSREGGPPSTLGLRRQLSVIQTPVEPNRAAPLLDPACSPQSATTVPP